MRRRSKFLGIVLTGAFAVGMFCTTTAFAQDAATDAAAAQPPRVGFGDLLHLVFSKENFWFDPVFWTIGILSIYGLTLIIQGFIKNRHSVLMPDETTEQIREMINQRKFKELLEFTRDQPSFISKVLHPALNRAPAFNAMKEAMETAIGEQTADQFRSIEYLNIVGNLGPLLGLIGTVMGMIYAFSEMQKSGAAGADPSRLAGGISKALCHTFLGLALAIPCLASFGVLRTIVDKLTVRGALVAEELLLLIKPQQDAKPAAAPAMRPGMATPQPGAPLPPGVRKAPTPMPPPH
ncbi:MAG TPA: MotA/TolQ/ExbB proton channel family protein [Tepidisphaeraceae bacterium]|jgi:biopolymer transport protein ExbB|nr:MotA/TolQ/ExbB proton channel family protein [Tepidisphaeraceae bacterium]